MILHAEPPPVKFHEVKTRNTRHHAGAVELFGQPYPPTIDEDLTVLWHHLNLQGATWLVVWLGRIDISRSIRPVRLLALNRVTCQRADDAPTAVPITTPLPGAPAIPPRMALVAAPISAPISVLLS